jgi:hypothetical protein
MKFNTIECGILQVGNTGGEKNERKYELFVALLSSSAFQTLPRATGRKSEGKLPASAEKPRLGEAFIIRGLKPITPH